MQLLSSPLPPYSGPFNVGTVDVEAPSGRGPIGDAVFKDTKQPAFNLETVLFSLYYPAPAGAVSSKPKHFWIPKPLSLTAEGYARFASINNFFTNGVFTLGLWALAGSITIPAEVDLPLRKPEESYGDAKSSNGASHTSHDSFPVIVFSHGMASSRTDYTQWCGELASRGYVVAAIEHRDGSGPGSTVMDIDGTERNVFHITEAQLERDPPIDTPALKQEQLNFRQAEIEETIRVLRLLNDGKGDSLFKNNPRGEGSDFSHWAGRLNMEEIIMGGHSYGATGALQVLKDAPSYSLPIKGAIILDPGKQSGPLNDDIKVPVLIIHSHSWSKKHSIFQGRAHFEVVKELAEKCLRRNKAAWFMTSLDTSHPSVTDAPLIEPFLLSWTTGATIDVKEGVWQYVKVSVEFLEFLKTGRRSGILAADVTHPDYDKDARSDDQKHLAVEEIERYWQIHIAPESST